MSSYINVSTSEHLMHYCIHCKQATIMITRETVLNNPATTDPLSNLNMLTFASKVEERETESSRETTSGAHDEQ